MKKASLREAQMRMLEILMEIDRICKKHNINYWLESGTLLGAARHSGFIPWDDDLDIGMIRADYIKFINIVDKELSKKYICQNPITDEKTESAFLKIRDLNSEIKYENNHGNYSGLFVDIFPYDYINLKNSITKKTYNTIILIKWFGDLKIKKPYIDNLYKNIIIHICKVFNMIFKYISYNKLIKIFYEKGKNSDKKECDYINYGIEVPFNIRIKKEEIFPLKNLEFEGINFPVPNKYKVVLEKLYGDWIELPDVKKRVPSHSNDIYIN